MVVSELTEEQVDELFHPLAGSTRRDLLRRWLGDESSVTHLASTHLMSFAAAQEHLVVRERAGQRFDRRE